MIRRHEFRNIVVFRYNNKEITYIEVKCNTYITIGNKEQCKMSFHNDYRSPLLNNVLYDNWLNVEVFFLKRGGHYE